VSIGTKGPERLWECRTSYPLNTVEVSIGAIHERRVLEIDTGEAIRLSGEPNAGALTLTTIGMEVEPGMTQALSMNFAINMYLTVGCGTPLRMVLLQSVNQSTLATLVSGLVKPV